MFLGQFFYEGEAHDRDFFTRLAHQFGFDVHDYLTALDRVPVFSHEKVDFILEYDKALVDFIADLAENALLKIKAEEETKRQTEFLQILIDAMPYAIFYKDRHGRYLGCNRAFEQFYGISREQIAGKTVHEIAPKELADMYQRSDDALFTHPGKQTYEGSIQSTDGIRHDVIFHKATFAGPDGVLAGLVGAVVDITERKQTERALAESVAKTRSILDNIGIGVTLISPNMEILELNQRMRDWFPAIDPNRHPICYRPVTAGPKNGVSRPVGRGRGS
jgi:PAS domain S-box-containing protein